MSGPVALHGGGEFLPGDEPFLQALLEVAARRTGGSRPIRVAVVPTAAARGRPDLAAANGVAAFERVAEGWLDVDASAVGVVSRGTAADPEIAGWLATQDVIHLPGGDPDLIPTVMPGTAAWAAITDAHAAGAVLAGASAGAMAFTLAPEEIGRLAHYRVLKELGRGGMGVVLLAEDPQLERQVALKIMLPRFAQNATAKERFLREAKAAAKVHHEHVITIYHRADLVNRNPD